MNIKNLTFVKIIKEYTGLGLKESKDFCDSVYDDFAHKDSTFKWRGHSEIEILSGKKIMDLIKDLEKSGGEFSINGGLQHQRNVKILDLGVGDKSDYIDFIVDNIHMTSLKDVLKKLDKDEILQIYKAIKNDCNL